VKFGLETESKYGSTICGMYYIGQEVQTWERCDSDVKTDMFILCSK